MHAKRTLTPITQTVYTTMLPLIRTRTTITPSRITSWSKCQPTTSIPPTFLLSLPIAGRPCKTWIRLLISTCPGTAILKCQARPMPTPSSAHTTARRSNLDLTSMARRMSLQPPYRLGAWIMGALTSSNCFSATG